MQSVSILILVDIGLVHINVMLDVQRNAISLNPYSCGYRTGTLAREAEDHAQDSLNPYSCGYRTGTSKILQL